MPAAAFGRNMVDCIEFFSGKLCETSSPYGNDGSFHCLPYGECLISTHYPLFLFCFIMPTVSNNTPRTMPRIKMIRYTLAFIVRSVDQSVKSADRIVSCSFCSATRAYTSVENAIHTPVMIEMTPTLIQRLAGRYRAVKYGRDCQKEKVSSSTHPVHEEDDQQ